MYTTYTHVINIILAFVEGLVLIISPCILPILPLILAGSLTGGKKRPLGIISGFVLIFSLFTLFSRKLVEYSGIDINIIRYVSYSILVGLGLIMLSTRLTAKFSHWMRHFARAGSSFSFINNPRENFTSGFFFGSLIAVIWTPCAGPIFASVIVQTVLQKTTWLSFLTILAFTLGAASPMLLIAFIGREIMPKFHFFNARALLFRKILGAIIIAAVGYMIYAEGTLF